MSQTELRFAKPEKCIFKYNLLLFCSSIFLIILTSVLLVSVFISVVLLYKKLWLSLYSI